MKGNTFIQIQTLSLGPKPLTICMKQIVQREQKESWKSTKPRIGLLKKAHTHLLPISSSFYIIKPKNFLCFYQPIAIAFFKIKIKTHYPFLNIWIFNFSFCSPTHYLLEWIKQQIHRVNRLVNLPLTQNASFSHRVWK